MDHPKIKTFSFEQLLETFPLLLEKIDRLETMLSKSAPEQEEKLLTRSETAELLRISLSTLNNWEKKGKIVPFGISAKRLYKKSELLANQLIKIEK